MDILGGQAVQASRLLTRLSSEPSIQISFLPVNPRLPGILRNLQRFKYIRTLVTSLWYWLSLLSCIPRNDIIHIFSASYFSFLLAPTPAVLVARLFKKASVLNYRSGEAEDHLTNWSSARWVIRLVDKIVVPSGYLVDVFAKFGFRASVISNFVDLDQFTFRDRQMLRPVFLSNRNFESHYNVACVLMAFGLIQQSFPEAHLTVVGEGTQKLILHRLAQQLKLNNTDFVGAISPEEMPKFYNASDIFLNAPNIDNMPGSIIESFATGVAVVTTDAGGIPYIVKDAETGLMVAKEDYTAMAHAAIRLLRDHELAARIVRNAYRECDKYKWSAVRSRWIALYNQLVWCDEFIPDTERV
ncbi:MAG: glycosyltransferase family 4 protein [Pyrinomonadaceae bacterium]